MARYIELVGVPGVGKTSTYNYLKNLQTEKDEWKLLEDLFRTPVLIQPNFNLWLKNSIKYLLGLPTIPKIKIAHNTKVLDDFIAQNDELIEIFWEVTVSKNHNIDGKDLRFHSVYYMMSIFQNLQAIKDYSSDKCFILDEGLILNLNYFTNEALEETLDRQISHVLDRIYLPAGVVLFEGDLETIIERTKNRGILKPRDQNLSDDKLRISREETAIEKRRFVQAVERRNIPIMALNATDTIESKAKEITAFAGSLGI